MSIAQKYYDVWDLTFLAACCDEIQYFHACIKCRKIMGCYYCSFNYDEAHGCANEQLSTDSESYPHPVEHAQQYAQCCAVFDMFGTLEGLWQSRNADSSNSGHRAIGTPMSSGLYT